MLEAKKGGKEMCLSWKPSEVASLYLVILCKHKLLWHMFHGKNMYHPFVGISFYMCVLASYKCFQFGLSSVIWNVFFQSDYR